jgi:hypothetical protein
VAEHPEGVWLVNAPDIFGRQTAEVRRIIGTYPIVEATADILIYVNAGDAAGAIPGDPNNCVFAKACKRSYGSRGVLFFPTVAYIDMPNEEGERVIFRARVKEKTRQAIEALDVLGDRYEGTFRLYAMPPSETISARRKAAHRRRRRKRQGTYVVNPKIQAAARAQRKRRKFMKHLGLRDGSGLTQTRPGNG